jgi:C-terminal processing protease CtpA/Prc
MPMSASAHELMRLVYRSLVVDSLLPSEPRRIAEAALAAIARREGRPCAALPDGFGADAQSDGEWLADQLPAPGPWWDVFHAMAWGSDRAHTGVVSAAAARAAARLNAGDPEVHHGFAAWRQPDGRLAVADVDAGGSAYAAGLRAGDVLLAVDGLPARRASAQLLPLYFGAAGAVHELDIERAGATRRLRLELRRGDVAGVVARRLGPAGADAGVGARAAPVGYVSVRWFSAAGDPAADTASLVRHALSDLRGAGARGLVLDLRYGVGGNPAAVVGIASLLSLAAEVFVERDAAGRERAWSRAAGDPVWLDRPLAVVVNEQTVSCGEYLALALAELEGAVLVGAPTAGGLNGIQWVPLGDGRSLALPDRLIVGPRRRVALPGCRLVPDRHVPNPTAAELAAGVDRQLAAAIDIVNDLG